MIFVPAEVPVLFCDEALLVVNKPAGLASLPDGYDPSLPHVKSELEGKFGRLWIVHRLDKETSGVLCLARSAASHRALNSQFEQHLVSKVYHALVIGNPVWKEQTSDLPLRVNGDHRHRTVVDLQLGVPARTHFRVVKRLSECCLLEAIPETGRTHQIRAHLTAYGLFIIGDRLYTPKTVQQQTGMLLQSEQIERMLLHALSLELTHPTTGERQRFSAPYPDQMTAVLMQLRSQV
jgi:tRNA pseudouridine32 synthase/23S rRNA pseudouridine746 synthase